MKFKCIVEYEYPVEHKPPVKAEIVLHGDRVVTDKITPLPKGHGDLIDRNECLKLKMTDLYDKDGITMYAVPTGNILRMKPVIEADKGE